MAHNLTTRTLANITADLRRNRAVGSLSRIEMIDVLLDGVRSSYGVAKATGNAAWKAELIEQAGALRAERATLIAPADEAGGVYEGE